MEQGINQLREQWLGHKKAREQLLLNAIRTTDEWIGSLQDPELGSVGSKFLDCVQKSGCLEEIDIRYRGIATYTSFSLSGPKAFTNKLTYGPAAEEDLANLFPSKVHEAAHALQKMKSAALHASPFNRNTHIIICPRDWITLEERCEQDSYIKQAWFSSLLAENLPEIRNMSAFDALPVEAFEKIRQSSANIAEAVVEAARQSLARSYYSDNLDSEYRFKHFYQDLALDNFDAGMKTRRDKGESNFIFVRLEPEDIAAIGASFGPNSFGESMLLPEFAAQPVMLEKTREKLQNLNQKLGISDENALPTLGEILQTLGMSREDFIAASYGRSSAPVPANANVLAPTL